MYFKISRGGYGPISIHEAPPKPFRSIEEAFQHFGNDIIVIII
jgi:hypothetical protein